MKEKTICTNSTSGFLEINYQNCPHLLPCGICEHTNKYCPVQGYSPSVSFPDITWTTYTEGDKKDDKRGI